MVATVKNPNEIYLSTTRFPIKGRVSPALISTLPGKVTIGDYSLSDDLIASNWVISDQRGGILVEEMEEAVHQDRCWFSDCQIGFKGHIVLPPLATNVTRPSTHATPTDTTVDNAGFENWSSGDPDDWVVEDSNETVEEKTVVRTGVSSCSITNTDSANTHYIEQSISNASEWIGYSLIVTAYARVNVAANTTAEIDLYRNGSSVKNDTTSEIASWDALATSAYTVPAGTTTLKIRLTLNADVSTRIGYFDDVDISYTAATAKGSTTCWENYNSLLYQNFGKFLYRIDGTATGFTYSGTTDVDILVYGYANNITALCTTPDGYLMVGVGDTTKFYYVDTNGDVAQHGTESGATFLIQWDAKMWKMDASGNMEYTLDITGAWTDADSGGSLANYDVTPKSLFLYRDADGDYIIYCGTTTGLWAYDFANLKWIETELTLPDHPTCGRGTINWHDASYISAGLSVTKYVAAGTAIINEMGLDRDDGLPALYRGEIVKFIKGYREFYALVDSSLVTGEGYSGVYAYDATGWQCKWLGSTTDDAMNSGIVSSVVAYNLWYDHNDLIYKIPLKRDVQNPLQDATSSYATAGTHFTPWFDGAWVGSKTALTLKVKCKGMSETEDVTVSYRIDHATTDITKTWLPLGDAIEADGETELFFPSSTLKTGYEFKAIQFRFVLARTNDAPTTDKLKTPDIQYVKLKYLKNLDTKWGWITTIDCSKQYGNNTPAQLDAALKTIVATKTLMEFTFRNESGGTYTHKVRVANCQGLERTGQDWRGHYDVSLIAP